jgi:hypothetical protein
LAFTPGFGFTVRKPFFPPFFQKMSRKQVLGAFKQRGLVVRPDAMKYLIELNADFLLVQEMIQAIDSETLGDSKVVDGETIRLAMNKMSSKKRRRDQDSDTADRYYVVDAFKVPKFAFPTSTKIAP